VGFALPTSNATVFGKHSQYLHRVNGVHAAEQWMGSISHQIHSGNCHVRAQASEASEVPMLQFKNHSKTPETKFRLKQIVCDL
jgi:hypothetical protein